MKNNSLTLIVKTIIAISIGFLIVYLPVCFYNITFDISLWSKDSRECVALGGTSFGLLFGAICFFNSETKD